MKFLKKLLDFYINASIHVALAVYSLVRVTELYFNLPYNEIVSYFIFYGTITAYNFIKYAGVAKLHHRSLTNNLKIIQIFSLFCFVAMVYYASQLTLHTLFIFAPFAILTFLYAVSLGRFSENLRNIPSLKIIVIALVWASTTVIIPVLHQLGLEITNLDVSKLIMVFVQRFLLVIVLTLPFDIRDFKYDKIALQTIPQKIGIEQTKKLGFILLGISLLLEFMIAPNSTFKSAFLVVFFILLVFLQRATTHQKKYYASFWIEAIPIFWWVLLLVFNDFTI